MKYSDIVKAHKYTFNNKALIEQSEVVGCFYCKNIYPAKEVTDFLGDANGDTAECPNCGIDSVLPDMAGYPINEETIQQLHNKWFEGGWKMGSCRVGNKEYEMLLSLAYIDGKKALFPPNLLSFQISYFGGGDDVSRGLYNFEQNIEIALMEEAEAPKLAVISDKHLRKVLTYIDTTKARIVIERLRVELPKGIDLNVVEEEDPKRNILEKMFREWDGSRSKKSSFWDKVVALFKS